MKIKHSLKLSLAPTSARFRVRLNVTANAGRIQLSTGVMLDDASLWNAEDGCVVPGPGMSRLQASVINRKLDDMKEAVEDVFRHFEYMKQTPTLAQVKERFLQDTGAGAPQKPPQGKDSAKPEGAPPPPEDVPKVLCPLTEVFAVFEQENGVKNSWAKVTYMKFNALLHDLESYRPGMKCNDLDESTLIGLVGYLRDEKVLLKPRRKKEDRKEDEKRDDFIGLRNSSIKKKLSYLSWFLRWAESRGYCTQTAYRNFKPTLKMTQKKVIYLTDDELRRVISLDLSQSAKELESVRDIFLFCCFSGLRYSDAQNLRWINVRDGYLDLTTVKTTDSIRVETNNMTAKLLDKYRDKESPDGYVLPRFTNQAMNRNLKELCRLAGINEKICTTQYRGSERLDEDKEKWQLVGTHTGRKTFIVQALSRGVSPNIVMKWTGHSDYAAMRPYIDIVDSIKAKEMDKMNFLD